MSLKIQSFFVFKFSSARLRDSNYKIDNLSLDQARQNGEVVRLSSSELIRAIQRIKGIDYNQSEVDELIRKKKKRKSNNFINEQLDKLLYIEDIITIEFDDSRHYKSIVNKGGIKLNGKTYNRLLAGAGMTRKSTVMFCNDEIIKEVYKILNCGRNPEYEIVPSKFNAYLALASSSTWKVSKPRFIVIPDYEVERLIEVDFLHENNDNTKDPVVSPEKIKNTVNLFDGQGLVSPEFAKMWAKELFLDYLPSAWIIRSAFLKGMLVSFDFHELARRNNVEKITDIYGNSYLIDNIDCIISVSQFKLWGAYSSTEDYIKKCEENNFSWGVTKYAPRVDKNHSFSTYQYLQNLKIEKSEQIESLCKKTIDWFSKVTGDSWVYTILFLMGDIDNHRVTDEWFDRLDNPLLQSLILEPNLINDKYIQTRVQRLISKKIKESYLGILLIDGNYELMISDPYAQAEWGMGLQVRGLLKDGEHYSQYWNNKNISKVAAIRSPCTWRTEKQILNLQSNEDMDYWYKYLNSGIVFNIHGNDLMMMSGADDTQRPLIW